MIDDMALLKQAMEQMDAEDPDVAQDAKDRAATMYIFGSQFDEQDGIHEVHMNQGSPGFDNGVWNDGGILFNFQDDGHWEGIFIAFASQQLPSDNSTGLPLPTARSLADTLGSPLPAREQTGEEDGDRNHGGHRNRHHHEEAVNQ